VERLGEELLQKAREQEQKLVKAKKEVEVRGEMLVSEMERELIEVGTIALGIRGEADKYAMERVLVGNAKREQLEIQAVSIAESGRAKAESMVAELSALEQRGGIAIREQLVANLSKITFKQTPFSSDPSPTGVEEVQIPTGKEGSK
jgi:hypothetical protein